MENYQIKSNLFDRESLEKLYSIENKTVHSIICYLWINQIHPDNPISIIDAVEFNFLDNTKIVLSSNESQDGLTVIDYNYDREKNYVQQEFQGKIQLLKVDASTTTMWKDIILQKIIKLHLTKDRETEYYLSDQVILEFENKEKRLIQVHPLDGVILDYHEEI